MGEGGGEEGEEAQGHEYGQHLGDYGSLKVGDGEKEGQRGKKGKLWN